MNICTLMLRSIPFFLFLSTSLASNGWIEITPTNALYFSIGAFFGTMAILGFYVHMAGFVEKKLQFVAKNFNFILFCCFWVWG